MPEARPLEGRIALVTGVSRRIGIGASVARRLRDDGARVFASGWEPHDAEMPWGADPGGREALLQELGGLGPRLHYEAADMGDPDAPARLVDAVYERFGALDIVVASHARSSHQGFGEVTADELDRCWAINARSVILLAQALGRRRPAGPGGRLVCFTSGQHIGAMDGELAYAVSKGALHQMTASLSNALIDRGITVNCINPGPTDTGYATGEAHARVASMFPTGRWGQPADAARLVAWLVGDEAAWITGQVLDSEGGFRRWQVAKIDRKPRA